MGTKVSIITPFKDSIAFFKSTYLSVINQDYNDFEWFIIDDGSLEEQFAELTAICTDPRVTILKNLGDNGAGPARNHGLAAINGDYFTFIDADDLWDSTFLSDSLSYLRTTNLDICYSGYRRLMYHRNTYLDDFIPSESVNAADLLSGCDISCLTFFASTSKLDHSIRFGAFRARNDLVFFYKFLEKAGSASSTNKVNATYRINSNSISSNKFKLIKYQYLVSRVIAKKSLITSFVNVLKWGLYGLTKYGKRTSSNSATFKSKI